MSVFLLLFRLGMVINSFALCRPTVDFKDLVIWEGHSFHSLRSVLGKVECFRRHLTFGGGNPLGRRVIVSLLVRKID